MDIRPVVKVIVKLLIITLVLYVIGLITQIVLFSYAAFATGVLMGLNMYWLGLCLIAYFIEHDNQKLSAQEESDMQINTPLCRIAQALYISLFVMMSFRGLVTQMENTQSMSMAIIINTRIIQ